MSTVEEVEDNYAKRGYEHYKFPDIYEYLTVSKYPDSVQTKSEKANFRRATKNFVIVDNELKFLRRQKDGCNIQLKVIWSAEEARAIIRDAHEGSGSSLESKSLQSHHGILATIRLISCRFYWRSIESDIKTYVQTCDKCQRVNPKFSKETPNLHPVAVPSEVMSQIGIDISCLPQSDGFRYVVVAIDYFSKWTEAKPLKDKTAVSVARFLYELICRFGCFSTQINDQGREFVNSISDELHRLTGVKQKVTSAYHPQANGLVERQNRTIKEKLLKILQDDNHEEWPNALDGVLFAHRTARHNSTGFSPYRVLYGRDPVLPIDVKYAKESEVPNGQEFDEEYVRHVVEIMTNIRHAVNATVTSSIDKAQVKQCDAYNKRHKVTHTIKPGDKVLLRNLKRVDRKGGKCTSPWLGPYTITSVYDNNTCQLHGSQGELKCKQHMCNLKPYNEREINSDKSNGHDDISDECDVQAPTEHKSSSIIWINNLNLTESDKATIIKGEKLDDRLVDAVQALIKQSCYPVDGLDSTLLVQSNGFHATSNQCVQIHFDENREHWVTSSTTRNRVELADSLFSGQLSTSVSNQLKQRYATLAQNNIITIYVLPTQQQVNGVDCGCHAIATAVEFLAENGGPLATFDVEQMRPHLVSCLEQEIMRPFPKSSKKKRGRKGKVVIIQLAM